MTTITIIADHAEAARERMAKLQKKAAKYGQTITATFSPVRHVVRETTNWFGEKVEYVDSYIDVEVEGSAPRIGNHELLARLTAEAGGVIIDKVPGKEQHVGEYGREWDGRCDHCGVNRQRNHGFVVTEGDKLVIVGRQCLRDYLGIDTPENVMNVFTYMREISNLSDDEGFTGSYRQWYEVTGQVLAATSAAIDIWGWLPASGNERHEATVGKVCNLYADERYMGDTQKADRRRLEDELRANAAKHDARAEAVINWARTELVPGKSDYLHNLKLLLGVDTVKGNRLGYVCSGVTAYERAMGKKMEAERAAKKEAETPSHHVGAVGERLTMNAKVEKIIALPDYGFGPLSIYCFRADDGALLSWKTSPYGAAVENVGVDDVLTLTGTVKQHNDFKGQPETRLSRCKLVKLEAKVAA